ncbi:MAG: hypothetical protein R2851_10900 [Caldilineaceae bacterium]
MRTEVELTGLEIKWVHFRRRSQPLAPNVVRTLPPDRTCAKRLRAGVRPTSRRPGDVDEDSYYIFIGDGLFTGTELQRVVQFVGGGAWPSAATWRLRKQSPAWPWWAIWIRRSWRNCAAAASR